MIHLNILKTLLQAKQKGNNFSRNSYNWRINTIGFCRTTFNWNPHFIILNFHLNKRETLWPFVKFDDNLLFFLNKVIKFERSVSDGIPPSLLPNFSLSVQFINRFYIFLTWATPAVNFFISSINLLPFLFHWLSSHLENSSACLNYEEDSF